MPVEVTVEIEIAAPVHRVAAFAGDPANAPRWYVNIEQATFETPPPFAVGTKVAFVAHFLGKRLAYTYEIAEYVPDERLVMRTAQGPFPMETTYTWAATAAGGTHMTMRNRGEPRGFSKLFAPIMARMMRRATQKDLKKLKSLMEGLE